MVGVLFRALASPENQCHRATVDIGSLNEPCCIELSPQSVTKVRCSTAVQR